MLCKEVMDVIEEAYPADYAIDWDNVGLLVGRDDKEVSRVYVALDADDAAIEAAVRPHQAQAQQKLQSLSSVRPCR